LLLDPLPIAYALKLSDRLGPLEGPLFLRFANRLNPDGACRHSSFADSLVVDRLLARDDDRLRILGRLDIAGLLRRGGAAGEK
jgi:hypothetical protein